MNASDYQIHSICRLSPVSKKFYDTFRKESIWKQLYENKVVKDFYDYKLSKLSESFLGQIIDKERKTKLVVINNSYFNYDVFWVKIIDTPKKYKGKPCYYDEFTELIKLNKVPLKPKEHFVKNSYHKTRIIVIPTFEEIQTLKFSNIGHSFSVNKYKEIDFENTTAYIKTIKQPKKLLPIKIIKQEDKTFKQVTTANYMEKYNKVLYLELPGSLDPPLLVASPIQRTIWSHTERIYVNVIIHNSDLAKNYKKVKLSVENSNQKNLDDMIQEKSDKKKEIDEGLKIIKRQMKILENSSKEYNMSIETLKYVKNCF